MAHTGPLMSTQVLLYWLHNFWPSCQAARLYCQVRDSDLAKIKSSPSGWLQEVDRRCLSAGPHNAAGNMDNTLDANSGRHCHLLLPSFATVCNVHVDLWQASGSSDNSKIGCKFNLGTLHTTLKTHTTKWQTKGLWWSTSLLFCPVHNFWHSRKTCADTKCLGFCDQLRNTLSWHLTKPKCHVCNFQTSLQHCISSQCANKPSMLCCLMSHFGVRCTVSAKRK